MTYGKNMKLRILKRIRTVYGIMWNHFPNAAQSVRVCCELS